MVETSRVHMAALQSLPKCSRMCEQFLTVPPHSFWPRKKQEWSSCQSLALGGQPPIWEDSKAETKISLKRYSAYSILNTHHPLSHQDQLASPSRWMQRSHLLVTVLLKCISSKWRREIPSCLFTRYLLHTARAWSSKGCFKDHFLALQKSPVTAKCFCSSHSTITTLYLQFHLNSHTFSGEFPNISLEERSRTLPFSWRLFSKQDLIW